jgi:antitoxin VapB
MNLRIKDQRAWELARRLADRRNVSITEAVIGALEAELRREGASRPLADRLASIAADLRSKTSRGGRAVSEDEIDEMWGCPLR